MLADIGGVPLVIATARQVSKARMVGRVIIATDDGRIEETARSYGFETAMTSAEHASGSDRVAEAAKGLPEGSVIVNVQGDEPLISPETIDQAVAAMMEGDADIVTVSEPIVNFEEALDSSVVKAVVGANGRALYFSRSAVPFIRDASLRHGGTLADALMREPELLRHFRKHVGLYVYTREYLIKFTSLARSPLEQLEMLEQLRALENGARIRVVESRGRSIGVDTEKDLARVREILTRDH
jgi:3-deoxy-manno-octulosonate cytidylyltransferase (CMP-KDO synthetase)